MLYGVEFPVTINAVDLPLTRDKARKKLAQDLRELEMQGRMPYGNALSAEFLDAVMKIYPPIIDMRRRMQAHKIQGYKIAAQITVDRVGGEGGSCFTATRSIEFVKKNNLAQARRASR